MSRVGSTGAGLRARAVDAFRTACRYDVLAFKPGNVSIEVPGHGMTARDFLRSAAVAAEPASRVDDGLGASLLAAVDATVTAVGCNTNLGILLLCVPLMHAAQRHDPAGSLRSRLRSVLATTTVGDAVAAFAAIRRANPAGLGTVSCEDVHAEPTLPLSEIMALASARDTIAAQYANAFDAVFNVGIPALRAAREQQGTLSWAMTAAYFTFLVRYPDTHVVRKWGAATAASVQQRGRAVESALKACEDQARRRSILAAFDNELKNEGVNPGTSADLTVASLLAWLLDTDLTGRAPLSGAGEPEVTSNDLGEIPISPIENEE